MGRLPARPASQPRFRSVSRLMVSAQSSIDQANGMPVGFDALLDAPFPEATGDDQVRVPPPGIADLQVVVFYRFRDIKRAGGREILSAIADLRRIEDVVETEKMMAATIPWGGRSIQ